MNAKNNICELKVLKVKTNNLRFYLEINYLRNLKKVYLSSLSC